MIGQVTVDGRQLNTADRFGDWKVLDDEGWFDTPDRKRKSEARDLADGDYYAPSFYESRYIVLSGRLKARGHDNAHEAENWLKGMLWRGSGIMVVRGHEPDQWARVELDGRIKCRVEPGTDDYMRWELRLKAIDPRKYGEAHSYSATTSDAVAVYHRGNYPATPSIVASGSMPGGYTLTVAGSVVVVTEPLAAGTPHTIDYENGRLYKGGTLVRGGLGTTSFRKVDPGQQDTFSIAPLTTGTGSAVMTLVDTFM